MRRGRRLPKRIAYSRLHNSAPCDARRNEGTGQRSGDVWQNAASNLDASGDDKSSSPSGPVRVNVLLLLIRHGGSSRLPSI